VTSNIRRQVLAQLAVREEGAPHPCAICHTPCPADRPALATLSAGHQSQCSSCWAHAATESIETHVAIATGNLWVLSQQQISSCTPNPQQRGGTGGCNGAIAELAFDHVKTTGFAQEWTDPYTSYWGVTPACGTPAYLVNISGYTAVAHNDANAVAEALAHVGPLAISVDASSWNDYETGIFSGCSYAKNISMDHAVQAVGYGHDYERHGLLDRPQLVERRVGRGGVHPPVPQRDEHGLRLERGPCQRRRVQGPDGAGVGVRHERHRVRHAVSQLRPAEQLIG
jgi:hypothetical protein